MPEFFVRSFNHVVFFLVMPLINKVDG